MEVSVRHHQIYSDLPFAFSYRAYFNFLCPPENTRVTFYDIILKLSLIIVEL